jgi:hypothetical protein
MYILYYSGHALRNRVLYTTYSVDGRAFRVNEYNVHKGGFVGAENCDRGHERRFVFFYRFNLFMTAKYSR